jgi:protein subunit release factor B
MEKIIELNEADLEETFSRASGPGGQNVNKVATRVTLRHVPTNICVSVQESRSQSMNRQLARERLLAALQDRERKTREAEKHRRAKLRRQQSKRPAGLKEKILESKHHRSKRKQERKWTPD